MAQKTKKYEEWLSISGETARLVSYADYFSRRPLFVSLQVQNIGGEPIDNVTLRVANENGMLIPCEKTLEIPFESTLKIELGNILSPLYFAEVDSVRDETVTITLTKDKKTVASAEFTVTALPFDFWQGVDGAPEQLASFVRPRLADCVRMQTEVVAQLKKWNADFELGGYTGNDKNAVRRILASLYACLRRLGLERKTADITRPVEAGAGVKLLSEKSASALELALFTASCIESMGLHPVLVFGNNDITCGAWLYDGCFLDTASDDIARLCAYASDGINNVSCFDIDDVFGDKNIAYSTSEQHFKAKAGAGVYERYVDVRRCRISSVLPMPLRAKSVHGFEVLSEKDASPDMRPDDLAGEQKLSVDNDRTKDKQWERRLLDLSMKNALLHFSPTRSVLHIVSQSADATLDSLIEQGELVLAPANEAKGVKTHFGASAETRSMRELIAVENASGILRVFADDTALQETALRLMKRNKEADEESGTKILYLALGFLKWYTREDGAEHYAPLVLQPLVLKKSKGGAGFAVATTDEEISVNSTLLEYLKQEFNIDIRGLSDMVHGLKISEILAMIRREVVRMRGWEVYDDCYIAGFSFARYQMWNDLRKNIAEFSKNELVSAMLNNVFVPFGDEKRLKEDEVAPDITLTPLPADESQWGAIALSQAGKSFVLHGPPGTGKSQTITNIIANALYEGKRVLFVAEKQAALSVVKKRLDMLGLGDFCLELHSNKTNKTDVLQKLNTTLALAGDSERVSLREQGEALQKLKEELLEPLHALHKKRRLGVSVYEAMLVCLRNKNAPALMNIESAFYDGLTKAKIDEYEAMMVQAGATAKECGGVHNSPFSNVNVTEYSLAVRDSVYCASEVAIAEIKHLKNYIALFTDLYRQKISALTRKRLDALYEITGMLLGGSLQKYFKADEEEFFAFFNANKRLDAYLDKYFKTHKKLVDISREYEAVGEWLRAGGGAYDKNKPVRNAVKRLARVAIVPYSESELYTHMETLYGVHEAMDCVLKNTEHSDYFTFAFGRVDFFNARKNFLKDLYRLHELCASVFMDYNPDSFNSMCIRATDGFSTPVLQGLRRSVESFREAEQSFLTVTQADKSKVPEEEIFDYYSAKAGALIENIDMLAPWCAYKKTAKALDEAGLTFITDALENGSVTSENIIDSFEKNIYKNFLQTNIPLDPVLAHFSAGVLEEKTESLRLVGDEFARLTREAIRTTLISRLPTASTEGAVSLEVANFARMAKSNLRGTGLRKLFEEIPELMRRLAPCMLMSPITVSQYLQAENGLFDIVIFDEASQIPTAEAICSIARAKSAVVVGDPKQLPPTTFFHSTYTDEEDLENEDMESLLDDCLAVNMPQRHLTWHYRSKHESLIAFSNATYYDNRLCTFPSPDALASRVQFAFVEDGVYDRSFTKKNKAEGDAVVAEVLRRLKDETLKKSSLGIVTFSNVQKEYIERKLATEIANARLEKEAYEREEPLFIKNLENVQGDERDVILFSVCYGPDKYGRISLNFGPLNQSGGWRRLNVAVSRAREEMLVFSSMRGAMIDLSRTNSKGVAGLKAFLDFAEKGRTNLAVSAGALPPKRAGLGKYIAEELSAYGYECRYDLGASGFKIDVAVLDPKNKKNFILAILCDTPNRFSVKDRSVLQIQTLKRNNWNVARLFSVNYYNNPKREIKKIKDLLDKLTGADRKGGAELNRAKKTYKYAQLETRFENASYITSGENDKEIIARLKTLVAVEEPISHDFLVRRCLASLGITKSGAKVDARMQALVALCGFRFEKILGTAYYRKSEKSVGYEKYRVETGEQLRKHEYDYTPYEITAIVRSALEDKVALFMDEINVIVSSVLRIPRPSDKLLAYINDCVTLGEDKGLFVRSVSDRISLA